MASLGINFIGRAGSDAQARRQDRQQAHRRGGRRPVARGAAGVWTLSRRRSSGEPVGYPLMLQATAVAAVGASGGWIRRRPRRGVQRTRDEAERASDPRGLFGEAGDRGPARGGATVADGQARRGRSSTRLHGAAAQPKVSRSPPRRCSPRAVGRTEGRRGTLPWRSTIAGQAPSSSCINRETSPLAFLEVNPLGGASDYEVTTTSTWSRPNAVAAGHRLTDRPAEQGHAIEARLNAGIPTGLRAGSRLINRLDLPGRAESGSTPGRRGDSIPADSTR